MPLITDQTRPSDLLAAMQARAAAVAQEGRNPVHDKEFKEARAAFRDLMAKETSK